jgi:hypothetical protein
MPLPLNPSVSRASTQLLPLRRWHERPNPKLRPRLSAVPEKRAKSAIKRRQTDGSKQDRVIALLRRREGATLAALVKATGWKPHSIRGFLAGTVRKKLTLQLVSEKVDGIRTYRIGSGKTAKKAKAAGARSA